MRLHALFAAASLALALSPLACSSGEESDPTSSPDETGDSADELKAKSVTDADNGKTITVTEGQNVIVKLGSNPTTGYRWEVASTDRRIGYPKETFVKNTDGAVGSGGTQKFTWKTQGGLSMVGMHHIKLDYKRANGVPSKSFTLQIKVLSGQCAELSPPAPGFCSKGRVEQKHDDVTGCVTGYECKADCRTNGCGTGSSCQMCWANFACVPTGALC